MPSYVAIISIVVLVHGVLSQSGPCRFKKAAGRQTALCHDISYDLTVPSQCVDSKCGIIVDVHGFTMNGTWEEALTEMSTYAENLDMITLQPTAGPGLPPDSSWKNPKYCAGKVIEALDDIISIFSIDEKQLFMGGSSQGGACTDAMMNGVNASRFAAFTVGAAYANLPPEKHSFLWFTGRHDTFTGILPSVVEPQLAKIQKAWNLTTHEMVSVGAMHEHHRWSDVAKTVEVEWLVHNYTLNGTIVGIVVAGHCAPGGHDAPPHPPFAHELGLPLRLSCPQPDPKAAEKNCWAGVVTSGFYKRHVTKISTSAIELS